eukprot:1147687-Pelagomonas_calceolata.AAC.3
MKRAYVINNRTAKAKTMGGKAGGVRLDQATQSSTGISAKFATRWCNSYGLGWPGWLQDLFQR